MPDLMQSQSAGYLPSGLPFNRVGAGPRVLVVFPGLFFENKPMTGMAAWSTRAMYRYLTDEYTVYVVGRKPGLPMGYSFSDMSDDYASMIRGQFGGPVDVLGTSTGGSIALYLGADHPDLVRRLVVHSSAHRLSPLAKKAQMQTARYAAQGDWRGAWDEILALAIRPEWARPVLVWISSRLLALSPPRDASDLIVTIEAEDRHDFGARLGEITVPTLVIAGDQDLFYDADLVRETAAGIPGARAILYKGQGHPAAGKQFERDVLAFLCENA